MLGEVKAHFHEVSADEVTKSFLLREDLIQKNNSDIEKGTRELLSQTPSLKKAFKITVSDDQHSFVGAAVDSKKIHLTVGFFDKLGKVLGAFFTGRDEERLTTPNQTAISNFFAHLNQDSNELSKVYKQGLEVEIFISKDPKYRYLECRLGSAGIVQNTYLASYGFQTKMLRLFGSPTGKLNPLLDKALLVCEVNIYLKAAHTAHASFLASQKELPKKKGKELAALQILNTKLNLEHLSQESELMKRVQILSQLLNIAPHEVMEGEDPLAAHSWSEVIVVSSYFSAWVKLVHQKIGKIYLSTLESMTKETLPANQKGAPGQEIVALQNWIGTLTKVPEEQVVKKLLKDTQDSLKDMEKTPPRGDLT